MNSEERQFAISVVEKLRDAGYEALWAGGCVRDLLMGNTPEDYDVATSAKPEEVRELFGKRRTLAVGMSFGVMIVLATQKSAGQVEVATFRTDADYSDGRRPDSVTFCSPQEDAFRRDFTINGMFLDPIEQRVVDYVNGQEDLEAGILRAIGDATDRIREDKLRMLRAIRFAARFGFRIAPETRSAIQLHAAEVSVVSGERIGVELQKTLQTSRAGWAAGEWYELGLLAALLPELEIRWQEVGDQVMLALDRIPRAAWQTKLAVMLLFVETEDSNTLVSAVRSRLKLANDDRDLLAYVARHWSVFKVLRETPWSIAQPLLVSPHASHLPDVIRAMRPSGAEDSATWIEAQLRLPAEQLDPQPHLVGEDLIAAGLRPSPRFKEILTEARRLQLDGELTSRDTAMRWLKTQIDN